VSFTCSDALSGISSYSSPTTLGEGASQSVAGICIDIAGNIASDIVGPVNIDLTSPAITGTRTPANSLGWNNDSVTVTFHCSDSLSGVDTLSSFTTLTSEGADQSVTGTCTDKAGNIVTTTVGDINIDLTSPVIASLKSVPPNSDGWNNVRVAVSFTCSDSLSGVAEVSSPTLIGEGASQSVTGTCFDAAGNSADTTESGLNVDLTPPVISSSRSNGPNAFGWNNVSVIVSFDCSDALSGVSGVSASSALAEGVNQSVTGTCIDLAGNSASTTETDISIDLTNPSIASSRSISPNLNDWNNVPVTVSFSCKDALSGVSTISPPTTLGEGASQSVTGLCVDYAGNSASVTENDINIDLTPPSLSGSASPDLNSYGWRNSDVTVNFTCGDSLSGVEDCSPTVVLSSEGAGQSMTGYATDFAGNTANVTINGINIDKTPPSISSSRTPGPNVYGWNNEEVNVDFACTDRLSGVLSVSSSLTLGEGAGQAVTGTCIDQAGNSASSTLLGINVDLTIPVATASRSVPPNANGWNNVPVTVSFTCSDSLSG